MLINLVALDMLNTKLASRKLIIQLINQSINKFSIRHPPTHPNSIIPHGYVPGDIAGHLGTSTVNTENVIESTGSNRQSYASAERHKFASDGSAGSTAATADPTWAIAGSSFWCWAVGAATATTDR